MPMGSLCLVILCTFVLRSFKSDSVFFSPSITVPAFFYARRHLTHAGQLNFCEVVHHFIRDGLPHFGFYTVKSARTVGTHDFTVARKFITCRVRSISAARSSSSGSVVRYSAAITLLDNPSSEYRATASSF